MVTKFYFKNGLVKEIEHTEQIHENGMVKAVNVIGANYTVSINLNEVVFIERYENIHDMI